MRKEKLERKREKVNKLVSKIYTKLALYLEEENKKSAYYMSHNPIPELILMEEDLLYSPFEIDNYEDNQRRIKKYDKRLTEYWEGYRKYLGINTDVINIQVRAFNNHIPKILKEDCKDCIKVEIESFYAYNKNYFTMNNIDIFNEKIYHYLYFDIKEYFKFMKWVDNTLTGMEIKFCKNFENVYKKIRRK